MNIELPSVDKVHNGHEDNRRRSGRKKPGAVFIAVGVGVVVLTGVLAYAWFEGLFGFSSSPQSFSARVSEDGQLVIQEETGRIVQTIEVPDDVDPDDQNLYKFFDINYDGVPDLKLLTRTGATHAVYDFWVYNMERRAFEKRSVLQGVVNPSFDKEGKTLRSTVPRGSRGRIYKKNVYAFDDDGWRRARRVTQAETAIEGVFRRQITDREKGTGTTTRERLVAYAEDGMPDGRFVMSLSPAPISEEFELTQRSGEWFRLGSGDEGRSVSMEFIAAQRPEQITDTRSLEDILLANTRFAGSGFTPDGIDEYTEETIGGHTFYVIQTGRFEGDVSYNYFLKAGKAVVPFSIQYYVGEYYVGGAWTDEDYDPTTHPFYKEAREVLASITVHESPGKADERRASSTNATTSLSEEAGTPLGLAKQRINEIRQSDPSTFQVTNRKEQYSLYYWNGRSLVTAPEADTDRWSLYFVDQSGRTELLYEGLITDCCGGGRPTIEKGSVSFMPVATAATGDGCFFESERIAVNLRDAPREFRRVEYGNSCESHDYMVIENAAVSYDITPILTRSCESERDGTHVGFTGIRAKATNNTYTHTIPEAPRMACLQQEFGQYSKGIQFRNVAHEFGGGVSFGVQVSNDGDTELRIPLTFSLEDGFERAGL